MGYTKSINPTVISKSIIFPYALGVLQSRAKKMNGNRFSVTDKDLFVLMRTKGILEIVLRMPVYFGRIEMADSLKYRIGVCSKELMDYIREKTENNTIVPTLALRSYHRRRNYIKGFLDARSSVTYNKRTNSNPEQGIPYDVKYPRISLVSKRENPLILAFAELLEIEGLSPWKYDCSLIIAGKDNLKTVLRRHLITEPSKLEKLANIS